ncbi:unnamed protein product [Discula destructiva]
MSSPKGEPIATSKAPAGKTSSGNKVAENNESRWNGFEYPSADKADPFAAALHQANYRWATAFSMAEDDVVEDIKVPGKHIILLKDGKLRAENVFRAWGSPSQKVQTLDEVKDGQKALGPIRRNGTFELTAQADSVFYEGHVCLSPHLAAIMIRRGDIRFYIDDVPVNDAAVLKLLDVTVFEAATRTCKVAVPPTDNGHQNAKALQKWFEKEWSAKSYGSHNSATTREKVDIDGLYEHDGLSELDSDDLEDGLEFENSERENEDDEEDSSKL